MTRQLRWVLHAWLMCFFKHKGVSCTRAKWVVKSPCVCMPHILSYKINHLNIPLTWKSIQNLAPLKTQLLKSLFVLACNVSLIYIPIERCAKLAAAFCLEMADLCSNPFIPALSICSPPQTLSTVVQWAILSSWVNGL